MQIGRHLYQSIHRDQAEVEDQPAKKRPKTVKPKKVITAQDLSVRTDTSTAELDTATREVISKLAKSISSSIPSTVSGQTEPTPTDTQSDLPPQQPKSVQTDTSPHLDEFTIATEIGHEAVQNLNQTASTVSEPNLGETGRVLEQSGSRDDSSQDEGEKNSLIDFSTEEVPTGPQVQVELPSGQIEKLVSTLEQGSEKAVQPEEAEKPESGVNTPRFEIGRAHV